MRLRASLLLVALAAANARATSPFAQACRSAKAIVLARVAGVPDDMGLSTLAVETWIKRGAGVEASDALPARLPGRAARTGSRWMLFIVRDGIDPNLGAWAPVDPEAGWLAADGTAGAPEDLISCAVLALDPPAPAEMPARLAAMVGRGDAPTAFALGEFEDRPEMLRADGGRVGDAVRRLLASRRVTPQTAAIGVRVLGLLARDGDDARLIDLVAAEAPPAVVDAAVEAMPRLARDGTAEMLEHAIGGATDSAVPGLLRLAGPAKAHALVPLLTERLASSRQPVRLAALASLRELGDASALPALRALASHPDRETARAAQQAIASWPAAP